MSDANEPQPVDTEDSDKKIVDSEKEDEDLDALLDDALEDFDKPIPSLKPKKQEVKPAEDAQADWSEEFMKQAASEFEKNIRMMMAESATSGEDEDFSENLLRVSQEAASKVFETQSAGDGGASFAETLRCLAESAESLQGEPDEATLAKMLEKMAFGSDGSLGGFGEGASGEMGNLGELLPAMQGMLQSLLSKELLYPSIKEIVGKYPEWLADNRSKIDAKEFDKYNRQYSVMQQVCTEFEDEKDTDDAAKKNARFEKILSLMQQMQECGHPPKELAGEAELAGLPTNPFGADFGQTMGGAGPENCILM